MGCRHSFLSVFEGGSVYPKNDSGDEVYPRLGNGDEYYERRFGRPVFARDRFLGRRYARDARGRELYPPGSVGPSGPPVLRSDDGRPLYAFDELGDETYPVADGREVVALSGDGHPVPARLRTQRQRYPRDRFGNCYFPVERLTKRPYYLLDEFGFPYKPVTRRGHELNLRPEDAVARFGWRGGGGDDQTETEEATRQDVLYAYVEASGTVVYTRDADMEVERFAGGCYADCLHCIANVITSCV